MVPITTMWPRDRKMLLSRKELRKIEGASKNSGFTIVPIRLFINDEGLAKVVIAVARGKKEYDKRHSIKEKKTNGRWTRLFKK